MPAIALDVSYSRIDRVLRLIWLIADQGIYAGSNFILNILFARWLSPAEYGLYAVSFTGFIFLSVMHWGAFLEPLLIQSPQIDANHRRSFVLILIKAHLLLFAATALLSGIALAVAEAVGVPDAGWATVGAGLGGMALLTLLTARRLCLVFFTARISAAVGTVYFLGVLSTCYAANRFGMISWFSIWMIMGGWSALCAGAIFVRLYTKTRGSEPYSFADLFRFQSRYAKWAIFASSCNWVSFDGVILFLAHALGLEAVALTRAIFNITTPLNHILQAMNASWLVNFSADHSGGRKHNITSIALPYAALIAVLVFGLWQASSLLVALLYGGRYAAGAWQLPIFCATLGMSGGSAMITSMQKARGGLWQGYTPQIASALVAVGASLTLIPHFGQPGAVYAMASGSATALLLSILLLLFSPLNARPRALEGRA